MAGVLSGWTTPFNSSPSEILKGCRCFLITPAFSPGTGKKKNIIGFSPNEINVSYSDFKLFTGLATAALIA